MQKKNIQQQYLSTIKPVLILYVLIGLIQSTATFLIPVSIGEFFTIYFNSGNSKGRLLQLLGIHFKTISSFFLFFVLLLLARTVFEYWERWLSYKQGELYVKYIREKIFALQITWTPEKFRQRHFGKYLLRYTNDMKSLQNYLTRGIMGCLKDVSFLLMGFFLLWMIHQRLTLYFMLMTLLLMLIIYFISTMQKKLISTSRNKRSTVLAFVTKSFQRFESIKLKNREVLTRERFNSSSDELYIANMKNNQFDSVLQSLLPLFQYSMVGVLLWSMTFLSNSINSNDALVFVLITLMMLSPMKRILKVPSVINKGKISLEKINGMLNSLNDSEQIAAVIVPTDKNQITTGGPI